MGLREVRSLAPDCTAAQLEGLVFESVHFDSRGCDFSGWILKVKRGEGRFLGPWDVDLPPCWEALGMGEGRGQGLEVLT